MHVDGAKPHFRALRDFPKMTQDVVGADWKPGCLASESKLCKFYTSPAPGPRARAGWPPVACLLHALFLQEVFSCSMCLFGTRGPLELDSESFWG